MSHPGNATATRSSRYAPDVKKQIVLAALRARAAGADWATAAEAAIAVGYLGSVGGLQIFLAYEKKMGRLPSAIPAAPAPPPLEPDPPPALPAARADKVKWSESEKEQLVNQCYLSRQNHPDASLTALCNRIMQQWPLDRRRTIQSVQAIPWLTEAITERFRKERDELQARRSAPPLQPATIYVQPDVPKILGAQPTAALLGELLSRYTDKLDALTVQTRVNNELLQRLLSRAPAPTTTTTTTTTTTKPKVLVAGFDAHINAAIEHEYGPRLKLTLIEGERTSRIRLSDIPNCDWYLIATKFVAHNLQDCIKARDRLIYVNGGLTTLRDELEMVLKKGLTNGVH